MNEKVSKAIIWALFFLSVSHKYLKCGEHRLAGMLPVKEKEATNSFIWLRTFSWTDENTMHL